MKGTIKAVLIITFTFYLLILIKLILLKYPVWESPFIYFNAYKWNSSNFVPLKTIILYVTSDLSWRIKVDNLAGNLIGFMPLGFLLPLITSRFRSLKSILYTSFFLSLTFEVIQLFTVLGSFDVDDLLLNTVGGLFGYWSFMMVYQVIIKKLESVYREKSVVHK